jgi:tripartite-type tricarboxylate transporter receptor subunit TctC
MSALALALVFAIELALPSAAFAQDDPYPSRPVRLLVASGPGGNPDLLARLLADRMSSP